MRMISRPMLSLFESNLNKAWNWKCLHVCYCSSDGKTLDVWIGLVGVGTNPTVFNWTDGAPITFTYWAPSQPVQPTSDTSCVSYTGEVCVCVGVTHCTQALCAHFLYVLPRALHLSCLRSYRNARCLFFHSFIVGGLRIAHRCCPSCARGKERSMNQQHRSDVARKMWVFSQPAVFYISY